MKISQKQLRLIIRSIDHSRKSGQFFFLRNETEDLHQLYRVLRDEYKRKIRKVETEK